MLNVTKTLQHLDISIVSPVAAIQKVRDIVEEANDPIKKSVELINTMIGLQSKFEDRNVARATAQIVAESIVKNQCVVDNAEEILSQAVVRAENHVYSKANAYHFVQPQGVAGKVYEQKAVVEGIETKVAIKEDGSIKKGGKQVLAMELYSKYVVDADTPLTNREFVQLLIDQLGMTKAGANTYAANCKKKATEAK